jgi:hypothetical protein
LICKRKSCRTRRGVRQGRPNRRDGEQNRQKRGRRENEPGKEVIRLHSEKPVGPRRESPSAVKTRLSRREIERGGKACWDAEQLDRDLPSRWRACITSSSFGPREARVRALRTGEDHVRDGWRQAHFEALMAHKMDTGPPVFSAAPISRSRSGAEPTRSGCSNTLTWRGFAVAPPFHWRGFRSGQGRQLRILAPYTTRRLPSASRRCSCGSSFWSAGHRSVPSGWSAKFWPEKRPAFQDKPTCGEA